MSRKVVKRNLNRLDTIAEEDIGQSGISRLDVDNSFFERSTVNFPPPKKLLTIRLDEDVVSWLKGQGRGYQTRINAILRAYYDAHKHEPAGRP